jgi:hypothetical protein
VVAIELPPATGCRLTAALRNGSELVASTTRPSREQAGSASVESGTGVLTGACAHNTAVKHAQRTALLMNCLPKVEIDTQGSGA